MLLQLSGQVSFWLLLLAVTHEGVLIIIFILVLSRVCFIGICTGGQEHGANGPS